MTECPKGIRRDVLITLRVFGPCSVAVLAKESGLERSRVCNALYRLRQVNLVCKTGPARYDVTTRGRRAFDDAMFVPVTLFAACGVETE